jgi:uncharacterized protein (DUF924 family)
MMALFRSFLLISSLTSIPKLTIPAARSASYLFSHRRAMSSSTSPFKLDANIFNATLYKQLTDVWLSDVDLRGEELDLSVMKRWFMASKEEGMAFDGLCRDKFAHALEAIGPDHLPEPTAQPFVDEIERVAREDDDAQAAWTALSLTLLLDQIPRNIYRTDEGLRKVYNHYDTISYALSRRLLSSNAPVPRVDLHPQWRNATAYRLWFYMPLMHSEELEAHDYLDEIVSEVREEMEALEGHKGSKMFLEGQQKAEKDHRDILDRFGRYPHRNGALRRTSTEEEKKFLEEGGATFGVAQEKKGTL